MEKAILKTLIYSDIFDYPLKAYEIHKWLIGRKVSLIQVEKALEKLSKKRKIKSKKDFYFLRKREGLVRKREIREKQSAKFLFKAKFYTWFLKIIPTIKLVGISGGLAMENADQKDDIDLFLVTSKNRLWLSRILVIGILDFLGVRRKAKMKDKDVSGKLCANILVEEDKLEQDKKDIFVAHEVLQMRVLWSTDGIYSKYLENNEWVFKFLPNWIGADTSLRAPKGHGNLKNKHSHAGRQSHLLAVTMENLAKKFQLLVMKKPQGMERIEDGALYFHPNDCRQDVLKEFKKRISKLNSGTP